MRLLWNGSGLLLGTLAAFAASGTAAAQSLYVRGGLSGELSAVTDLLGDYCADIVPGGVGCEADGDLGRGDFGDGFALDVGVGYRLLPMVRAELLLSYRPDADFWGSLDPAGALAGQPVSAEGTVLTAMAVGYLDLPGIWRFQPFVGAGIGASYNWLDALTFRFPELDAVAEAVTQGGGSFDFTYMLTAGTAIHVTDRLSLDLAYRYTDLGTVRTEAGPAELAGAGGTMVVELGGAAADHRTHGVAASLRFEF